MSLKKESSESVLVHCICDYKTHIHEECAVTTQAIITPLSVYLATDLGVSCGLVGEVIAGQDLTTLDRLQSNIYGRDGAGGVVTILSPRRDQRKIHWVHCITFGARNLTNANNQGKHGGIV